VPKALSSSEGGSEVSSDQTSLKIQSLKRILNFELIILSSPKGVSSVERLNNCGVG
jgi:hypothetical protein